MRWVGFVLNSIDERRQYEIGWVGGSITVRAVGSSVMTIVELWR